jgi:hypothetical protein
MTKNVNSLQVIEGGGSPSPHRKPRGPGKSFKHECQICTSVTGVSCNKTLTVMEGQYWSKGKLIGGHKAHYCAGCALRGTWSRIA